MKRKLAYLGPDGTFSSQAARLFRREEALELEAYPTIGDVTKAVERGDATFGVVPIENSIQGPVSVTTDLLLLADELYIYQAIELAVEHCLMAAPGTDLSSITHVQSHPQALGQCGEFLKKNLPGAALLSSESTAKAAQDVSLAQVNTGNGPVQVRAAIANRLAAELYGLSVLVDSIQDYDNNRTRFVVLGKTMRPQTGRDRTTLVFAAQSDRPGSLVEALSEFASRQINLTRIESRPTKKLLGEYLFFVDLDGHISEPAVHAAVQAVRARSSFFRLLGTYPKHL